MTIQSLSLEGFANTRERNRFGISLPLIFGIGIYFLIITHASAVLRDPDTFWHIIVGQWIIAHGTVPDHGIFSATMANAPWLDQEWLAEILMAWGYDHFGFAALAVGTALCEAAAMAILLRALLGMLPPIYAMFGTVLAGGLWFPHLLARPYILTIPILVVWAAALVRARSDDRAPSPWFALLILLWANLHGSFMFGIGLAGLFAVEAVLLAPDWRGRVRTVRDWGFFGVLSLGAASITPYGLHGLLFPFHMINMTALTYIGEWQGVNFSQSWSAVFLIWLLAVLFAALSRGWRLPPTRIAILQASTLHGVVWGGFVINACSSTGGAVRSGCGSDQDRPSDGRISKTCQLARGRDIWRDTRCDHDRVAWWGSTTGGRHISCCRRRRGKGKSRRRPGAKLLQVWWVPDLFRYTAVHRRSR